jgi:hypothetical protein
MFRVWTRKCYIQYVYRIYFDNHRESRRTARSRAHTSHRRVTGRPAREAFFFLKKSFCWREENAVEQRLPQDRSSKKDRGRCGCRDHKVFFLAGPVGGGHVYAPVTSPPRLYRYLTQMAS